MGVSVDENERMKIIRPLLTGLLIGLTLLLASAAGLAYIYGDKIALIVVNRLNQQLESEVTVKDIDVSFIRKFPNATVTFSQVLIKSPGNFGFNQLDSLNSDTLFYARKLHLQFNIRELIKKHYQLNYISVEDAGLRVLINQQGGDNYHFYKSTSSDSSEFSIDLKKVDLSNLALLIVNEHKQVYLSSQVEQLDLAGTFTSEKYDLRSSSQLVVNQLVTGNTRYAHRLPIKSSLSLRVAGSTYQIKKGELTLAKVPLKTEGTLAINNEGIDLDLSIIGKNLSIEHVLGLLPAQYTQNIEQYSARGKCQMVTKIKGQMSAQSSPQISSSLNVSNGQLQVELNKQKVSIDELQFSCSYSNGPRRSAETSSLSVRGLSAKIMKTNLSGTATIRNFVQPEVQASLTSYVNLADVTALGFIPQLKKLEGQASFHLNVSGKIDPSDNTVALLAQKLTLDGDVTFEKGQLALTDRPLTIESFTGNVVFTNNQLNFSNFKVISGNNDVMVSGTWYGAKDYLFNGLPYFNLTASLASRRLNLDELLTALSTEKKEEPSLGILFPDSTNLKLNVRIDQFAYRTFACNQLNTQIDYKPRMFVLKSVSMQTMDGMVEGGGAFIQRFNNDIAVKAQTRVSGVRVEKLFAAFDDFGQKSIQARHVKGTLSGNVDFSSEWKNNLEVYQDRIVVNSDIEISNGELINYEPMLGLSRFVDISELKHIYFSTLHNQIMVKDRKIIIPLMDIRSSALNVALSGSHTFDNELDYHVRLRMSEVLFRKSRKLHKTDSDLPVERAREGGMNLYLSIAGTTDKPVVAWDRRSSKNAFASDFKKEREELRQAFRNEFSSPVRDRNNELPTESESTQKLSVIWDEGSTTPAKNTPVQSTSTTTKTPVNTTTKSEFKLEWDDN